MTKFHIRIERTRQVQQYEPLRLEITTEIELEPATSTEILQNYCELLLKTVNNTIERQEENSDPSQEEGEDLDNIPFD